MKRNDNIDDQLSRLLKEASREAPENMWFTKKVMNRLPEKHRTHNWLLWTVYAVAAAACCAGWGWFLSETDIPSLLKDCTTTPRFSASMLHAIALIGVTATLLWQIITTQLHSDHP